MNLLIPLLFAIFVICLVYYILEPMITGAQVAKNHAINKANLSLSDMFMFIDLSKLITISIVLTFILVVVVYLLTESLILPILIAIGVSFLPNLLLKFLKNKRSQQLQANIPELLLNISSSLKSGNALPQAIELSSKEQGGAVTQEFGLFLSELRLGINMSDALDNMKERMQLTEMELIVAAIKISREIGGNLADVLYRLAETLRKKHEMESKIKTLTAQGRMQGLVMVFLPVFIGIALFFMDSTSQYITQLFTQWYGWLTLSVLIIMLSIGYFFIRKIVNIDV